MAKIAPINLSEMVSPVLALPVNVLDCVTLVNFVMTLFSKSFPSSDKIFIGQWQHSANHLVSRVHTTVSVSYWICCRDFEKRPISVTTQRFRLVVGHSSSVSTTIILYGFVVAIGFNDGTFLHLESCTKHCWRSSIHLWMPCIIMDQNTYFLSLLQRV